MKKQLLFVSFLALASITHAAGGATLKGSIVFKGAVPTSAKIKMTADPMCMQGHPQGIQLEEYVVGKAGELKNVFVYIKEGLEGKTFPIDAKTVTLNQEGCQYKPHVMGVQAGQAIEIVNSDPTLHNVNGQFKNNPSFNFAQPVQGMKNVKKFDKAEVMLPLICNIHPWMKSYVGVVNHPFFSVTGDNGQFEITDLPAGSYVLEAWHEKLGTSQQKISVKAGEKKQVSFVFSKP